MGKKFWRIIIIALLVVVGVLAYKFINGAKDISDTSDRPDTNDNIIAEDFPLLENKELGDIQTIIEYGPNVIVAAHWPAFERENIDRISQEWVDSHIEEFKDSLEDISFEDNNTHYELNIDYESFGAAENLVSISFYITEDSSGYAHPDVNIYTKVYDLSKDTELDLADIMEGDYLNHIAQVCENYFRSHESYKDHTDSSIFEEGIGPVPENYSNFILKDEKMVFRFAKYQLFSGNFGMPSVEIPLVDLKEYIKPEFVKLLFGMGDDEEDIRQPDPEEDSQEPGGDVALAERDIDPDKPMIALTYDDGPNKKTTVPILDTLKEYDGVATFFILGNRVANNADILKRMLNEGSEIGNHSYSHKELTKLSYNELMEQINKTQEAVIENIGYEPKFVRPTYGSYNDQVRSDVKMPLILWSVDTLDWKSRDAGKVIDHVLTNVKDGDVILMHDLYDSTVEATQFLVPKLIDMGFQLVTVSELFKHKGIALEAGKIYR